MSAFLFGVPGKLKTLVDRLTSARAGYLDNLDATISSRAAASTALSSATWTGTRAGKLDEIGIKLIQTGTIAITIGVGSRDGSNTATITSVSTSKAIVLLNGATQSTVEQNVDGRVALTNSTTVTAYASRNSLSGSMSVTVGYTVIEFN